MVSIAHHSLEKRTHTPLPWTAPVCLCPLVHSLILLCPLIQHSAHVLWIRGWQALSRTFLSCAHLGKMAKTEKSKLMLCGFGVPFPALTLSIRLAQVLTATPLQAGFLEEAFPFTRSLSAGETRVFSINVNFPLWRKFTPDGTSGTWGQRLPLSTVLQRCPLCDPEHWVWSRR